MAYIYYYDFFISPITEGIGAWIIGASFIVQ